jgi:hypothetical protein
MRHYAAPLAFLLLTGCAGIPAVGPVLTEAANAACSAQTAANTVGSIAAAMGDATVARRASQASTLLGLGCLW